MAMSCKGLIDYFYEWMPLLQRYDWNPYQVLRCNEILWGWFILDLVLNLSQCCCFAEIRLSHLRPELLVESLGFLFLGGNIIPLPLVSSTKICIYWKIVFLIYKNFRMLNVIPVIVARTWLWNFSKEYFIPGASISYFRTIFWRFNSRGFNFIY